MLWYLMRKEWLLLCRDWHGLALLFLMPTLFILVMSLALRDQFGDSESLQLDYAVVDRADSADSGALLADLAADPVFLHRTEPLPLAVRQQQVARDALNFLVIIEPDFLDRALEGAPALWLEVAPATSPALAELFAARLREVLAARLLNQLQGLEGVPSIDIRRIGASVVSQSAYRQADPVAGGAESRAMPSAVQQNVPAWLLFAMFFIAIPLSTTVIRERDNGTLARLATMGVSRATALAGKLLPYVSVNLIQALLMVAVGMWLVPMLGGDALRLGSSWAGLGLMTLAASLAAVSYALLLAQIARTTEQATLLSGVTNILLAALGGVMVPRFLMPPAMQDIGLLAPMAWGLDGFLDLLLRSGGLAEAWPEIAALLGFALAMWLSAMLLASRSRF